MQLHYFGNFTINCFLVAGISITREAVWGRVDLEFIITMVMFTAVPTGWHLAQLVTCQ